MCPERESSVLGPSLFVEGSDGVLTLFGGSIFFFSEFCGPTEWFVISFECRLESLRVTSASGEIL